MIFNYLHSVELLTDAMNILWTTALWASNSTAKRSIATCTIL